MRRTNWLLLVLLLLGVTAGCCSQPEIFQKVHTSMETVQNFYDPLIQGDLSQDERLQRAVVAADTTLLLAGELQRQWCPDPGQAKQLELQTGEAKKLAQEAGVPVSAVPPAQVK
jgi:hypothetical protein